MTFPALIDWLDDRLNPIVVKELRQAVKSRLVVAILMLFLGIQLFLLFVFLLTRGARGEMKRTLHILMPETHCGSVMARAARRNSRAALDSTLYSIIAFLRRAALAPPFLTLYICSD